MNCGLSVIFQYKYFPGYILVVPGTYCWFEWVNDSKNCNILNFVPYLILTRILTALPFEKFPRKETISSVFIMKPYIFCYNYNYWTEIKITSEKNSTGPSRMRNLQNNSINVFSTKIVPVCISINFICKRNIMCDLNWNEQYQKFIEKMFLLMFNRKKSLEFRKHAG